MRREHGTKHLDQCLNVILEIGVQQWTHINQNRLAISNNNVLPMQRAVNQPLCMERFNTPHDVLAQIDRLIECLAFDRNFKILSFDIFPDQNRRLSLAFDG